MEEMRKFTKPKFLRAPTQSKSSLRKSPKWREYWCDNHYIYMIYNMSKYGVL